MLTQLSTVKARLAILDTDTQYDDLLTRAIEAISATLLAFVEPGDEVLVTSPTYASYLPAIRLTGATPRFVALNEDANFDLDPEAIGKAITRRTRAILLCNPNNPTGTVYSAAETERMMAIAARGSPGHHR